jgi:hypothetical protein
MRALILALAIAGAAGAASAQQDTADQNGEVRFEAPIPAAPTGVRKQAEDTVRKGLVDPDGAEFRGVGVDEVASVKRGAFGQRIPGPVSVVCGQYDSRDRSGGHGGYAWFFVAIKRGEVLWADVDKGADGPGVAYYGCKAAGLAR